MTEMLFFFIAGVVATLSILLIVMEFKNRAAFKRKNAYREVDEIYKAIGRVELRVIKLEKARGES